MKKGEKEGKEKFAISLKYNKMQRNEKCPLPSVNQRVAGSSPARGAKTYRNVSLFFVLILRKPLLLKRLLAFYSK